MLSFWSLTKRAVSPVSNRINLKSASRVEIVIRGIKRYDWEDKNKMCSCEIEFDESDETSRYKFYAETYPQLMEKVAERFGPLD